MICQYIKYVNAALLILYWSYKYNHVNDLSPDSNVKQVNGILMRFISSKDKTVKIRVSDIKRSKLADKRAHEKNQLTGMKRKTFAGLIMFSGVEINSL